LSENIKAALGKLLLSAASEAGKNRRAIKTPHLKGAFIPVFGFG